MVTVSILPQLLVARMVGLPDGEKKFENMITRFDAIHERERQTDTSRRQARIGSVARHSKCTFKTHEVSNRFL